MSDEKAKPPETMSVTEIYWEMSELYEYLDSHDRDDDLEEIPTITDDMAKAESRLKELSDFLVSSIADLSFLTNSLLGDGES